MSEPEAIQRIDEAPPDVPPVGACSSAEVRSVEDPRVIRCLHEYGLALQAGTRPPRQDILAMFPEIAEELSACLDGLEFVHHVAPQLGAASHDEVELRASQLSLVPLGDFRIVREIGRGGMGVVYEAEQMSLGRRVALKVLPFASVLDSRQLQRFKNEAQAAASLHHTHIVPVYSVGCERGVHYYAMQYIEGQTLAEAIGELRIADCGLQIDKDGPSTIADNPNSEFRNSQFPTQPIAGLSTSRGASSQEFFRSVARLGVEVAEALDYAHQQGVVHRDVKPMNLILDEHGEPWIADFGLARIAGSGASLTLTGDLLGTLRYMSPEQASAERAITDHRTDIYSLGVTLYELLTLEPAFAAGSRDELLRRIASEEPRPPRRLNSAVPLELETIVLKAMAKQPSNRYATAQALADDLRRYLLDQPILARRPTSLERLRKWSRRHKSLVASVSISTLATLLLAVVALAISYVTITREQKRTAEALDDAKAGRAAAAAQREQADDNLRQALAAMDQMLSGVSKEELGEVSQSEPLRRRLLEDALGFYKVFLQQRSTNPVLQREMARTYHRIGNIHRQLGQLGQAESALRRGLADFERLAAEHPDAPQNHVGVAEICTDLGVLLWEIPGRERDAEDICRRAVDASIVLLAHYPDVPAYESRLAQAQHALAYFLGRMKRFAEAEEAYHLAIAIVSRQAAESPNDAGARLEEATFLNSLGLLLRQAGRPLEAEQAHRRALSLLEANPGIDPRPEWDPNHENQLARSLSHLALAVEQSGRRVEAESLLRRALDLRGKPLEAALASPQQRGDMALTSAALARLLVRDGRPTEAEPFYQRSVELQELLVSDFPAVPKHRHDLAAILEKHARLLIGDQRAGEAEPLVRRALALREALVSQSPDARECRRDLAYSQLLSAMVGWRLGKEEQAQAWYDQAVSWIEAHPDDDAELQALRGEAEGLMQK